MWTILRIEMDSNFKKKGALVGEGGFYLVGCLPYPSPPLRRRPMHANHVPLKIEGVRRPILNRADRSYPLNLLSISISKIVHARNTHAVFSCGLTFS